MHLSAVKMQATTPMHHAPDTCSCTSATSNTPG